MVVPHDAVTGLLRLSGETFGLLLQIVPTLSDVNLISSDYHDGSSVQLTGSGFIDGAHTILLGTAIGAGGASEVEDLWSHVGPDAFQGTVNGQNRENAFTSFTLPADPPTGPVKVRTLGGSSESFELGFSGIAAGTAAARGTPANAAVASANVREAVTLLGAGFDIGTEVVFEVQASNNDLRATRALTPVKRRSSSSLSLTVIVPDDAVTGTVRIVGAEHGHFLQIVPTITQLFTPSPFTTGAGMTVQGSGFIEGDVTIELGGTVLPDTGFFIGPDVHNAVSVGAGMDRADNDGLSFNLPPGAGTSVVVRTSGGWATLISISGFEGSALSGTPADGLVASANPGQTIRLVGSGVGVSTEIIFPIIDANGTVSNRVVRPDLASVDGTAGRGAGAAGCGDGESAGGGGGGQLPAAGGAGGVGGADGREPPRSAAEVAGRGLQRRRHVGERERDGDHRHGHTDRCAELVPVERPAARDRAERGGGASGERDHCRGHERR